MKCDNCRNKDICKHVEYMKYVEDEANKIELKATVNIKVDIKCGYMQEKNCVGTFRTKLFDFEPPNPNKLPYTVSYHIL